MTPAQQEIVSRSHSTAKAIQHAVGSAPADALTRAPRQGEWSVQEVLTHTLNAELFAFDLCIRRMLVEEDPLFPDYDEPAFREALRAPLLPMSTLVKMIVAEHELLAQLLSNLPESAWQRVGHHAVYGARTLEHFARRVAEHTEEHLAQVEAITQAFKAH